MIHDTLLNARFKKGFPALFTELGTHLFNGRLFLHCAIILCSDNHRNGHHLDRAPSSRNSSCLFRHLIHSLNICTACCSHTSFLGVADSSNLWSDKVIRVPSIWRTFL